MCPNTAWNIDQNFTKRPILEAQNEAKNDRYNDIKS